MAKSTKHSTISARLDLLDYSAKFYSSAKNNRKVHKYFVYQSGETIKGHVYIDVKEEQPVDLVTLRFIGAAWHKKFPFSVEDEDLNSIIAFNVKHRRSAIICYHEKKLLDATKIVEYQERYGDKNPFLKSGKMKAQNHKIAFEFKIRNHLKSAGAEDDDKNDDPEARYRVPPSYEDANMKIAWLLHLEILRPEPVRAVHVLQPLHIMPKMDAKSCPDYVSGYSETKTYEVSGLAGVGKAGTVEAKVISKKMGYAPGDALSLDISVNNRSNKGIKGIDIHLVRSMSYVGIDKKTAGSDHILIEKYVPWEVSPGTDASTTVAVTFDPQADVTGLFERSDADNYHVGGSSSSGKGKKTANADSSSSSEDETEKAREQLRLAKKLSPRRFGTSLYLPVDIPSSMMVDHTLYVTVHVGKRDVKSRPGQVDVKAVLADAVGIKVRKRKGTIRRGIVFDIPLYFNVFAYLKEDYKRRIESGKTRQIKVSGVVQKDKDKDLASKKAKEVNDVKDSKESLRQKKDKVCVSFAERDKEIRVEENAMADPFDDDNPPDYEDLLVRDDFQQNIDDMDNLNELFGQIESKINAKLGTDNTSHYVTRGREERDGSGQPNAPVPGQILHRPRAMSDDRLQMQQMRDVNNSSILVMSPDFKNATDLTVATPNGGAVVNATAGVSSQSNMTLHGDPQTLERTINAPPLSVNAGVGCTMPRNAAVERGIELTNCHTETSPPTPKTQNDINNILKEFEYLM